MRAIEISFIHQRKTLKIQCGQLFARTNVCARARARAFVHCQGKSPMPLQTYAEQTQLKCMNKNVFVEIAITGSGMNTI